MTQYSFDCTLTATITVEASSKEEAEAILRANCDGMDCNGGLWPDGDPILFEAGLEGEVDFVED